MKRSCERDERGWRIPRKGTKSYEIYHFLVAGWSNNEIYEVMGEDPKKFGIRVLAYNIRNPEKKNSSQKKWRDDNPLKAYEIEERSEPNRRIYSAYVRKLVKTLGMSYTEAYEEEQRQLRKSKCA